MSLVSRLALVTGGGSGIGRAVCKLLAKEGASVAVAGNILSDCNETVAIIKEDSGHSTASCHPFEVDVSDSGQVSALFAAMGRHFTDGPPLSICVNSAGIIRNALLLKMTEKAFDDVINVNLKGTFLVSQSAAKHMVENGVTNGSIVNIASILGKLGNTGQGNYSASKGGVMALTRTFARELSRYGIRCNTVLPGLIKTPMTADIPDHIVEEIKKTVALGRLGEPEEVAELVAFLASDKSSYITGSHLEVTGGMSF